MKFKIEHKNSGIIGTAIVHVALLLILALLGFSVPLPLPEEEGITINFGYDNSGSGMIESGQSSKISRQEIKKTTSSSISKSSEKETITQNFEDAASVKETTSETVENKAPELTREEKEAIAEKEKMESEEYRKLSEAMNAFGNNAGEGSAESDGHTGGTGNQGAKDGSPDSRNYIGGGIGNGISFSLGNRSANALPKPYYNIQEEGKVVVEIVVDKYGNVTRANPGVKGTTTTNKTLWNEAKKAALNTHFNKDTNAPIQQKGTITYHFTLQ